MKRYRKYKETGFDWISQIPAEWSLIPLKYNLSLKGRIGWNGLKSDEFEEKSYAYLVTGQDFNNSEIDWCRCYQINKERYEEDPFIQISNGDILVTKDGTIGKVVKVVGLDKPACLNSGIFVVKQKVPVFNQNYLYWFLVSNQLKEFVDYNSTGSTIAHLYQNVFENMPLAIPSLAEQVTIATYLDNKVGIIDAAITSINTQIDDLNNYCQSVISEVVTKGLNPNVRMKNSSIEWIGNIPETWAICTLGRLYPNMGSGSTPNTNNLSYYVEEGENWLQTGDLTDGIIFSTSKHLSYRAIFEKKMKKYPKYSVVIAMYGATIGKIGYLYIETTTNQACCVLPPIDKINNKYIFYLMKVSKSILISKAIGGGQPNISQSIIKEHKIPIPSVTEQEKIVIYLDVLTAKVNDSIEELQSQREDLIRLRQSIISEAVTGKVDLREK